MSPRQSSEIFLCFVILREGKYTEVNFALSVDSGVIMGRELKSVWSYMMPVRVSFQSVIDVQM